MDSWPLEIVEVRASPIMVGKDAREVAAPMVEEFDFRKLNRRHQTSAASSSSQSAGIAAQHRTQHRPVVLEEAAPDELDEISGAIKVLPVLTVVADNTYLRAEPSQSSDIKLTLATGTSVTAFEQAGAWVHVGANDGSSITGFVHQSTVVTTEIN